MATIYKCPNCEAELAAPGTCPTCEEALEEELAKVLEKD